MTRTRSGSPNAAPACTPKPTPQRPGLTPLRHPTPSTSDIHALYGSNILTLEQRAEEMSQGGSDIADEIRRMNDEQKDRSRQNSIQSSHHGDAYGPRGGGGGGTLPHRKEGGMSRKSSCANSIVDVNGPARWGGYSPGGFVSSPTGSIRSGSWSHASVPRKVSLSGSSRLAQMVEPMQEGRPLDSPVVLSQASLSRQTSRSSFGRRSDRMTTDVETRLELVQPPPPTPPPHAVAARGGTDDQTPAPHAARQDGPDALTPPHRPRSADTFQEAELAFKDFDGVHFSPAKDEFVEVDENGNEVRRVSARNSSGGLSADAVSMLRAPRAPRPTSYAPPPADGMIYYPAPVPRMLNLPKRLSQLPAADVQAKRRTQLLNQLPADARHSAPWLSQTQLGEARNRRSHVSGGSGSHKSAEHPEPFLNERMSVANMHNLPPQLRASVFFDHQSVQQDVEVKSESAVATLDSILAASATAPVGAFTDHPFAGDVRKSVYAPESASVRKSTTERETTPLAEPEVDKKATRRRSSLGNLLRRSSSGDKLSEQLKKNSSRTSILHDFNEGGKKLQKRRSQLSLADGLNQPPQPAEPVRTPENEIAEPDLASGLITQAQNASPEEREKEQRPPSGSRSPSALPGQPLTDTERIDDGFKAEEAQEDVEEGDPVFAAPTTLLAELQVRKANQKGRNRTAATAFPNGMHSTLLQLDAVEEIRKNKRKTHRVPLAWEDPTLREEDVEEDDDVPLAMLFPGTNGLVAGKTKVGDGKDWDRPLGLMEKRELEDSEPLMSRRNRLQGLPPNHGRVTMMPSASELHLTGQPETPPEGNEGEDAADENEGETLAQRLRRLRTKDALDTAISDIAPKNGERPLSTFTDDVLSQFGGLEVKDKPDNSGKGPEPKPTDGGGPEGEETLGQRRARLQREREASGEQKPATHPALRASASLANLLSTNPVGVRKPSRQHLPAQGTLLHANEEEQAKQKAHLANTNTRSSSFYMDRPLIGAPQQNSHERSSTGLLGQQPSGTAANGGFAGGIYNNGVGGIGSQPQLQSSASTPMVGMHGTNSYFASPTAGYRGTMGPVGYGLQPQAQMMNPTAYQALSGGPQMLGNGYAAMGAYGGYGVPAQMPHAGNMGLGMAGSVGMSAMEEQMDSKQRDAIDRWRMNIVQ